MGEPLWALGVTEIAEAYRRGDTNPEELVDVLLARIEAVDPAVGSFTEVLGERARADARRLGAELAEGRDRGPLHGVPVGVKELFAVDGASVYGGSDVVVPRPGRESTAVTALREAGAVVLGMTRTHEFAWGITTQHETRGSTRNPWDLDRVPGGSSGGSGAAVAAGLVPLAVGTDTGCSVRLPAAFCGVAGVKPTYGRFSLAGVVPLAPSLDHVGFLGRDVASVAAAVGTMQGRPAGLRVGTAADECTEAADALARHGATVSACTLPSAEELLALFADVQGAEAYSVHTSTLATYPSQRDAYGRDVLGRLEWAAGVTFERYVAALAGREELRGRMARLFTSVDVVLSPVARTGPSTVDDPDHVVVGGARVPLRTAVMGDTVLQNLIGAPACAVPVGLDADGLPVSVQVTGAPGRDELVLAVAAELEAAFPAVRAAWRSRVETLPRADADALSST